MAKVMERADAAYRCHDTLSKNQKVILAMRLLLERGRHAVGQPLVSPQLASRSKGVNEDDPRTRSTRHFGLPAR